MAAGGAGVNIKSTMTSPSLLLPEHKQQFEELGYCVVPELFSAAQIQEIEEFFEEYKHGGGHLFDGGAAFEEIDATQRQLRAMNPHRYSSKAREWFLNPNVAATLEALLEKPALGAQTMY